MRKRGRGDVLWFAVDATPTHWAVYRLAGPTVMPGEVDVRKGPLAGLWLIDDAESYALSRAVAWAHEDEAAVAVIGNDNQVVGHCYHRGYAKPRVSAGSKQHRVNEYGEADLIDEHIREANYVAGPMIVVIADVPGVLNVADIGTRPTKVYSEEEKSLRLQATWDVLNEAKSLYEEKAMYYVLRTKMKSVGEYLIRSEELKQKEGRCEKPADRLCEEDVEGEILGPISFDF